MEEDSPSFKKPKIRSQDREETFQTFCKQILKTTVFQGCYQERRFVDTLRGYRDVIVVDKNEKQLIKDLGYIRNRILNFYEDKQLWVGITLPTIIGAPAAGVSIWTEISDVPFGNHWFYIKTVKFHNNEFIIKVTSLRSADEGSQARNYSINNDGQNNDNNYVMGLLTEFYTLLLSWRDSIFENLLGFLSHEITKENIIATLKFICLLLLSLATFSIQVIQFIGVYSLKFMVECRLWMHTCTPIILKLIELISKVIGGFYILLAMMWRDAIGHKNDRRPQLALPPANFNGRHALPSSTFYKNLHNHNNRNNRRSYQ